MEKKEKQLKSSFAQSAITGRARIFLGMRCELNVTRSIETAVTCNFNFAFAHGKSNKRIIKKQACSMTPCVRSLCILKERKRGDFRH